MATYSEITNKSTSEIIRYTVDFTNDLPGTVTVSSGTAVHVPPSGTAIAITTTTDSPYLYVTFGEVSILGLHYIDVLATFSDAEKASVRIPVNVVYPTPTARVGMANLIQELRGMTEAGGSDYFISGVPFWTDSQLQDILDLHREDVIFQPMTDYPNITTGGASLYKDYRSPYKFFEATTGGTEVFYIQDGTGATIASSNYTPDYRLGRVLFSSDQGGTTYYITGRSYDLNASAAEIWRMKANHAASAFDFSTDNTSVKKSQIYKHYLERATHFESLSSGGVNHASIRRSDDVIG